MRRKRRRKNNNVINDYLCALDWSNNFSKTREEQKQDVIKDFKEKKIKYKNKMSEEKLIGLIKDWINHNKGEYFEIWKEVLEEQGYI